MRGGRRFQPAAQGCAVERGDERDVAARHRFEIGVAIEWERQPLRAPVLPIFRSPAQVEPGAEIVAMTEDDAAFCFFAGTLDGVAQLLHHGRIETIALVRAVQPDKGDLAFEFIGDGLFFAHGCSWFNGGKSMSRCAMAAGWIALVRGYRVRPG